MSDLPNDDLLENDLPDGAGDEPTDDLLASDEPVAPEDDLEPEGEPAPAPQRNRAQERIRQLSDEVRQLRQSVQQSTRQPPQQQPAPDLSAMSPDERHQYEILQMRNQFNGAIGYMADQLDQLKFETLKTRDPVIARLSDRVEATFQDARQRGLGISREEALKFVLGEEMLKRKSSGKAPRAAAKPAAGGKPVSGRSRGAAAEGDADFDERMKNYTF